MAKQYIVSGQATVFGHAPGEKFHADLKEDHELRMINGGFLSVVQERTTPPAKAPAKASGQQANMGADAPEDEKEGEE
jgi:hypothetical protein